MSYSCFAEVYDRLMDDADYEKRADYIVSLFSRYGHRPKLMLDAACGTGSLSVLMAKRGIETIGVDLSPEMLSIAREKCDKAGCNILLLCQNLAELDLYGTVDSCICTLDAINHITQPAMLQRAFSKISLFCEPGAIFIFDVNTTYKHRCILGNNTFIIDDGDLYCVWKNRFFPRSTRTDISLDFFVGSDDCKKRMSESFSERAYTAATLRKMLKQSEFEILDIFGDMSFEKPARNSQRNVFVCRKIGEK